MAIIACEKQFTLKVEDANTCPDTPELLVYYKCDDASGARRLVESHAGKDAIGSYGEGSALSDVISGAGQIGTSVYCTKTYSVSYKTAADAVYYPAQSFTMRVWVNQIAALEDWDGVRLCDMATLNGHIIKSVSGVMAAWLRRSDGTYHKTSFAGSPHMGWHRFMFWWCNPTKEIGLQIDNDAPAIGTLSGVNSHMTLTGVMIDTSQPPLQTGNAYVDEVAIWKGVLSSSQRLYDWNSGNGRTYPNVPGI